MLYVFGVPFYLWLGMLLSSCCAFIFCRRKLFFLRWVVGGFFVAISFLFLLLLIIGSNSVRVTDNVFVYGNRYSVVKFSSSFSRPKYYVEKRYDFICFSVAKRYFHTNDGPIYLGNDGDRKVLVRLYRRDGHVLDRIDIL